MTFQSTCPPTLLIPFPERSVIMMTLEPALLITLTVARRHLFHLYLTPLPCLKLLVQVMFNNLPHLPLHLVRAIFTHSSGGLPANSYSINVPIVRLAGNKCFSLMYFNCRSILPKLDELAALCSASNPDIVL